MKDQLANLLVLTFIIICGIHGYDKYLDIQIKNKNMPQQIVEVEHRIYVDTLRITMVDEEIVKTQAIPDVKTYDKNTPFRLAMLIILVSGGLVCTILGALRIKSNIKFDGKTKDHLLFFTWLFSVVLGAILFLGDLYLLSELIIN